MSSERCSEWSHSLNPVAGEVATMLLAASDLVVEFPISQRYAIRALDHVSLAIGPGESVAIMGPSGSGKSTLIRAIRGIAPIRWGALAYAPDLRIALAVQRPEDALFAESVEEEVAFALRMLGCPDHEVGNRVARALGAVGLDASYRFRDPLRLSGGEQRRVAIAAVLALEPHVLVLDEPTSGLDPKGARSLRDVLARAGADTVLVVVTHDADDAVSLCSRVVVMCDGRIAIDAPVEQVLGDAEVAASFGIDAPFVVRVAAAVARSDGRRAPTSCDEDVLVDWIAGCMGSTS